MEAHVWKLMFSALVQLGAGKKHPGCSDQSRINSESFVHSICVGVRRPYGFENQSLQEEIGMKLRGICVSSSVAAVRRAALL